MPIPEFRDDGYLPEGLHRVSEAEVVFRFGSPNRHRRALALQLRRWLELARRISVVRFLVNGSFVTAKPRPKDIDAAILLPTGFAEMLEQGNDAALEINALARFHAYDFFAAETEEDWLDWVDFFAQTREADQRRKGLIEVEL